MKKVRNIVAVLGFALCAGGLGAGEATPFVAPEPEDLIIYHVFIDRFDDGDPTNNNANPRGTYNPSNPTSFHGGDLEGVRRRLPYIRGLGANGIWLSPFLENVRDYHGYGTFNWYNVDPNFGTLAKLRQLVNEANDMGIAVYYDMVAGHCGDLITSSDPGFPAYKPPPEEYTLRWRSGLRYPAPFNSLSYFHAHGNIGTFDVIPEQEIGQLQNLDDLKTETPEVQALMTDIWKYWIRETGVSGFRIDTVKHIDVGFWNAFLPALAEEAALLGRENYFTFGEVYGGNDPYMAIYLGTMDDGPYKLDGVLDFQYYYASNGVFALANRTPGDLLYRLAWREYNLGAYHHHKMPNFIDNHDVRRFLNLAQNNPGTGLGERLRRLELALSVMFCLPGPPVVYYGTEQGFDGGNDPFNRENMFAGQFEQGPSIGDNFDSSSALYRLTARLSDIRHALAPLRRGDLYIHTVHSSGPGAAAFSRVYQGKEVYVVFNNSPDARQLPTTTLTLSAPGTEWVNALSPTERQTASGASTFPARALAGQAMEIWVREADLPPTSPDVGRFIPAAGDNNVPVNLEAVEIQFLVPMNTGLTESALSIVPAVPYTVEWDEHSAIARLVLQEELVVLTEYTVTVAATATSMDGGTLGRTLSAAWTTEREPLVLPELAAPLPLPKSDIPFVLDGSLAEWPTTPMAPNTGAIIAGGVYIWQDAIGDDTGDGNYTYPTNNNFSQNEADFDRVFAAWNDTHLHLAIQPVGINPAASFFTPYFGVAISTGPDGRTTAIGFDQANGIAGVGDLLVRRDMAPNFEVVYTGPRGASLVNSNGQSVGSPAGAHSQATGVVELSLPWADLGGRPDGIDLVFYSGLETFGSMREVGVATSQWEPGGGIAAATDPDVFDLVGATAEQQLTDLSGYDAEFMSTVLYSVIRLALVEHNVEERGEHWLLF